LNSKPIRAAEMVSFGGSAVLRFRDNLHLDDMILKVSNPLVTRVSEHEVRIVMFRFVGRPATNRIEVYCQTSSSLSEELGRKVVAELQRSISMAEVVLFLRNDDLFAGEWHFPWIHIFRKPGAVPPKASNYEATRTLYCKRGDDGGDLACVFRTFQMAAGDTH
jgi:hypothetical protein